MTFIDFIIYLILNAPFKTKFTYSHSKAHVITFWISWWFLKYYYLTKNQPKVYIHVFELEFWYWFWLHITIYRNEINKSYIGLNFGLSMIRLSLNIIKCFGYFNCFFIEDLEWNNFFFIYFFHFISLTSSVWCQKWRFFRISSVEINYVYCFYLLARET